MKCRASLEMRLPNGTSRRINILGLDPGLQKTGWGLISVEGNTLRYGGHGVIQTDAKLPLCDRLAMLFQKLCQVIEAHDLDEACVEETFVNMNQKSSLKLGMARGIIWPYRRGICC